jgi:hypothetical protein
MTENILKTLKKFGLSDNEALVYVEALKKDELSPFQISKLTNIPRTTVYDVLMSLALKGLVELDQSDGFQKQQTKVRAKNPSILRKILQQKRDDNLKLEVEVNDILPELKGLFHKDESNANFRFFPGIEGCKSVYKNIENDVPDDEYIWSYLMPDDMFGSDFINEDIKTGTKIQKKYNKSKRFIIPLNPWTKHVLSYQYSLHPDYFDTREFRFIESPMFECFLEMSIKGDVINIACTEEDEVWGMIIQSKALVKTLKSIYSLHWNMATPVTKEVVESWGKSEFLEKQKELGMRY